MQDPHAPDPKYDFLQDPVFLVTTVQSGRELTVPRGIRFDVGVHQVEGHTPHVDLPDPDIDRSSVHRHLHNHWLAIGEDRWPNRRVRYREGFVPRLLPAVGRYPLVKIALWIEEAHADQRHAQVARFLTMVPGQNAESAAIDRKRLVQPKLGREIRDQAVHHLRMFAGEPGGPLLHVIIECEKNAVVPAMK